MIYGIFFIFVTNRNASEGVIRSVSVFEEIFYEENEIAITFDVYNIMGIA